jgi:hypothetical protein
MGGQLLASKIVIVEEEPRIRSVPALPTAVVGAVGIAERGPVGVATLVTSFEEYVQIFGGFTPNSDLAVAAMGFFLNGGSIMWVVRTVHYTDITSAATRTSAKATVTLQDRAETPLDTLQVDGKWDGIYASNLRVIIAAATSGAATEFNLSVEHDGVIVEVFPNLSMATVESVVNNEKTGSNLIEVQKIFRLLGHSVHSLAATTDLRTLMITTSSEATPAGPASARSIPFKT